MVKFLVVGLCMALSFIYADNENGPKAYSLTNPGKELCSCGCGCEAPCGCGCMQNQSCKCHEKKLHSSDSVNTHL